MNLSFGILIFLVILLIFEIIKSQREDDEIRKHKLENRHKRMAERTSYLTSGNRPFTPQEKYQIREIVYDIVDEENTEYRVPKILNAVRDGMIMGLLSGLIIGGDNKSAIKGALIWSLINGFLANIKLYI
jgi:hypothetical protein